MTKVLGRRKKARSFSGCKCCKQAKRKCPEERPQCSTCEKLGLKCEVGPPLDMVANLVQYDLNFLFRCELVDFSGRISKAARITRPGASPILVLADPADPVRRQNRTTSPSSSLDSPTPSPPQYIHYEFIDESPSIVMSPTVNSYEHVPTPMSRRHSSVPAFSLLLKAAHEEEMKPLIPPTPPHSPPEKYVLAKREQDRMRAINRC
jgi:Fungal Zn(2)-Cys(6) binuclear cluster domain